MKLQDASLNIWDKKYRLRDRKGNPVDETIESTYRRVARALAEEEGSVEKTLEWYPKFLWALENGAIPAGRILANAGAQEHKSAVSLVNCVVAKTLADSMDGVLSGVYEAGMTLKAGCGIGYEFSTLRPRGAYVAGAGASTSGPVSFMDIFDKMCFTISSAGGRRGAQMATFDISHPDAMEFIKAKRENGKLRQFNMSLLITDEFINAVKADAPWTPYFPISKTAAEDYDLADTEQVVWHNWPTEEECITNEQGKVACKVYESVPAKDLWEAIMSSTYDYAEPGFILIDKVNEMNNNWFCENIRATNPCVTAETLVAVAGRAPTPIKTLVEEGVDVPVYCCDPETGETFVRMGRQPRLTGRNKRILKITLDDGSVIRTTENHKFLSKDGKTILAEDLKPGDDLMPFSMSTDADGEVFVKTRETKRVLGYHLIAEAKYGRKFDWGRHKEQYHTHHINFNHFDNSWDNIEVLTASDHCSLHLTGDLNPMRRWWDELDHAGKEAYRKAMSASCSGEGNGMWGRTHSDETKRKIGDKTTERNFDPEFKARHKEAMVKWSAKPGVKEQQRQAAYGRQNYVTESFICKWCEEPFEITYSTNNRTNKVDRHCCSQECGLEYIKRVQSITPAALKAGWVLNYDKANFNEKTWDSFEEAINRGKFGFKFPALEDVISMFGSWNEFIQEVETFIPLHSFTEKECEECSTSFLVRSLNKRKITRAKYCSSKCRSRVANRKKGNRS